MKKANCWEVQECGREPGGYSVEKDGVCPAAAEESLSGINHGTNGGRICWVVPDTNSRRWPGEKFATECTDCHFFRRVREEEGEGFVFVPLDAVAHS